MMHLVPPHPSTPRIRGGAAELECGEVKALSLLWVVVPKAPK